MDYLSVLGIFKNEAHALGEWIEHYLWQGADSIHLIDNNSDDDWSQIKLKYESNPKVSFYSESKKHYQVFAYWKVIEESINSKYLLAVDLDEFVYVRNGFSNIKEILDIAPFKFSYMYIPWKNFGSSGHIVQPPSIRRDFVWRIHHDGNLRTCGKSIFNLEDVKHINIHNADRAEYTLPPMSANLQEFHRMDVNTTIHATEDHLRWSPIHCNHYKVQSFNHWTNVKMTRGDGCFDYWDNVRDVNMFHQLDTNQVKDNELSKLIS